MAPDINVGAAAPANEGSMKMTIFLTLILSLFVFNAYQTATIEKASQAKENAAQSEIKQIYAFEAKQAIDKGNVQFIDVRAVEEYKGGHAPKAVNFPLDELERNLAKLDEQKPVYVICETGRRSQKAAEILRQSSFKEIYNIQGGTRAWIDAGFPTEK
jgi:rhodanese-related sulfurtransferase